MRWASAPIPGVLSRPPYAGRQVPKIRVRLAKPVPIHVSKDPSTPLGSARLLEETTAGNGLGVGGLVQATEIGILCARLDL